jgi:hypothetical protein
LVGGEGGGFVLGERPPPGVSAMKADHTPRVAPDAQQYL